MCLTIPARVLKIKGDKAVVEFQNKKKEVDTQLVDNIKIGEYALISNGFIIKKVSNKEAQEIINIINPK